MENNEFARLVCSANREELLALWAIMCCDYIKHDAETDAATANYRNGYTNGEKKRTIRRCRITQSALRRKGDTDAVAVFERAIGFIRSEVLNNTDTIRFGTNESSKVCFTS